VAGHRSSGWASPIEQPDLARELGGVTGVIVVQSAE
jgi:hypothetical protein